MVRAVPLPPLVPRLSAEDRAGARRRPMVRGLPGQRPAMPLPAPPLVSKRDVVFGVCLTNRQGRIGDLVITSALGWAPGLRVGFTVTGGVIVVAADEAGSRVLDHRCYLWLPTVVRRAIGVYEPARVLLAGLPSEQRLIIHPMVMLERLTATVHAAIVGDAE